MTTDPFTEAARAEAEQYGYENAPTIGTTALVARAHLHGWEAARAYLAAQEPTDAESIARKNLGDDAVDRLAAHFGITPEATDGERAVRALHRRIPLYEHEALCADLHDDEHVEAHHHEDVGSAGDYYCDLLPIGPVCDTCRDEDGERADWPCSTIQVLDSASAARRDEETTR